MMKYYFSATHAPWKKDKKFLIFKEGNLLLDFPRVHTLWQLKNVKNQMV